MNGTGDATHGSGFVAPCEAEKYLPAAGAMGQIAFGPGVPPALYVHEWGVPPDPTHVTALAARANNQRWRPTEPLQEPAWRYRADVRKLMRQREKSAQWLLENVLTVMQADARRRDALVRAEDVVTAAVRAGVLRAIGVRLAPDGTEMGFPHEWLPPAALADPGRVISLFGDLEWRVERPPGPSPESVLRYVDIRVHAEQVRQLVRDLWVVPPLDPDVLRLPGLFHWRPASASHVSPWEAVYWRAFGSFWSRVIDHEGPPPPEHWRKLRSTSRLRETPNHYAYRMGQVAARDLAERELRGLLASGRVVAYGRPAAKDTAGRPRDVADGMYAKIPPEVFLSSDVAFHFEGMIGTRRTEELLNRHFAVWGDGFTREALGPLLPLFFEVHIPTSQLIAVWGQPAPATPQERPTVKNETMLVGWLVERMKGSPLYSPGKGVIKREAVAAEFKVGTRGFNRAWDKAVEQARAPAWKHPGRKPQRRIETPD